MPSYSMLDEPANARRGLAIYFAVLIPSSTFFEWKIIQSSQSIDSTPLLILALMYMPALASIIARIALREGFEDVSFRLRGRNGRRALLLGWVYPSAVGLLAYGTAWATGLATFQPPLTSQSHLYSTSATTNFLSSLLLMATLGTVVSCIFTFGEELGWRGYMLTRLISADIPKPIFVSGLVWALWHVPLILTGQYASGQRPLVSSVFFVIGVIAEAYLAAYLRLRSGSVWPAVIFHGAANAIIQGTFDRATVGTPQAVGESGWMTAICSVALVSILTRGVWIKTAHRAPAITPSK